MTKDEKKFIKNLLRSWGCASKSIREQSDELNQFKKACNDIERVQNNGCGCQIISIESLRKKADRLGSSINKSMKVKTELDSIISTLPYNMRSVLVARYVKKVAWEYVPLNLPAYMSERQCYRLHSEAMELILAELYKRDMCHDLTG